jgi:hypothetical protein
VPPKLAAEKKYEQRRVDYPESMPAHWTRPLQAR